MKKIAVPDAKQIVSANKYICKQAGSPHHCDVGKVESAIHAAFYPGAYPFEAGGLARVAAALCFYLVKSHAFVDGNKRVGALAAISFLNVKGWDLKYPVNAKKDIDALAEVIDGCAAGRVTKEKLMDWFDAHKVAIEE